MTTVLALASIGFLGMFASSAPNVSQGWSPEQWAFLSAAIITSSGSAIGAIVAARRTGAVHRSLKLPSNGIDAGELLEAMGQVQHLQANLMAAHLLGDDVPEIPSAEKIARELKKLKEP